MNEPQISTEVCEHCDTTRALCLEWKLLGYVACCPECTHAKRQTPLASPGKPPPDPPDAPHAD